MTSATLLSFAAAALPVGASPAVAADNPPAVKRLFTIRDDRVTESSGLAKSQKHDNLWWTVNDSNDSARIFGLNKDGDVEAVLTFRAEVRDVEAIAVGRDGTIYVGDIGDNLTSRDMITVYAIAEPDQLKNQQVRYLAYDFEYPDGAHNAETLLIHPQTQRMYFVTKAKSGKAAFYAAPEEPSRVGVNELERLADAPPDITDGIFLPDARGLVLRTYLQIAALTWGPKPNVYARTNLPPAQGESVAMGPSSTTLAVGSEGSNSVVYQVPVPLRKPTAAASPKPTATTPDTPNTNHNLRWILIGAGVFALLVAFVTFPAGRRERDEAQIENQRGRDRQRMRSTV